MIRIIIIEILNLFCFLIIYNYMFLVSVLHENTTMDLIQKFKI